MASRLDAEARDRLLFLSAVLLGAGTWFALSLMTNRPEAWDSPLYWSIGLPVLFLGCVILGYLGSRSAWRWGLVAIGAQAVSLMLTSGQILGNLFPFTIALWIFFAACAVVACYAG